MDPLPTRPLQACLGLPLPRPSRLGRVKAARVSVNSGSWTGASSQLYLQVGGWGQGTEVGP